MELSDSSVPLPDLHEISSFFKTVDSHAFETKISDAVATIRNSENLLFIGLGSSGTLAKYAARYFSNLGKFAAGLEDSHYSLHSSAKTAVVY